jgi:hypothetical protein
MDDTNDMTPLLGRVNGRIYLFGSKKQMRFSDFDFLYELFYPL